MNEGLERGWGIARLSAMFSGMLLALAVPTVLRGDMPAAVLAASVVLGGTLALLCAHDVTALRLPDALTLPLLGAGLAFAAAFGWGTPADRVLGAAAGFFSLTIVGEIYRRVRGRAGLGLGDAKLFAASGAWLGWQGLPAVLLWASGIAVLAVLVHRLMGGMTDAGTRIPFGPFLAAGTWLVWLYGGFG